MSRRGPGGLAGRAGEAAGTGRLAMTVGRSDYGSAIVDPHSRMPGVPSQHSVRGQGATLPEDLEIRVRVGAECEPEHEAVVVLLDCTPGKGLEHEAVAARGNADVLHGSDGADLQGKRRDPERDPDGPECVRRDGHIGRDLDLDERLAVVVGYAEAHDARRPGEALRRVIRSPKQPRPGQAPDKDEYLSVVDRHCEFRESG